MNRIRKERINHLFMLGDVISNRVVRGENDHVIRPWDYYPELFREDREKFEEFQRKEELETYKENRRKYVDRFNAARNRQEVIE